MKFLTRNLNTFDIILENLINPTVQNLDQAVGGQAVGAQAANAQKSQNEKEEAAKTKVTGAMPKRPQTTENKSAGTPKSKSPNPPGTAPSNK
jgi:hypothetical protein